MSEVRRFHVLGVSTKGNGARKTEIHAPKRGPILVMGLPSTLCATCAGRTSCLARRAVSSTVVLGTEGDAA